jgi:hypothetical protein
MVARITGGTAMYTTLSSTNKNSKDEGDASKNSGDISDSKAMAIAVARLLIYAVEDLKSIEAFESVSIVSTAISQLRDQFKICESDLFHSDEQNDVLPE